MPSARRSPASIARNGRHQNEFRRRTVNVSAVPPAVVPTSLCPASTLEITRHHGLDPVSVTRSVWPLQSFAGLAVAACSPVSSTRGVPSFG